MQEPTLDRQAIIDELVNHHGLEPLDFYLLPLIPLVEIAWADGRIQKAEAALLLDFTRRWLALLRHDAGDEDVVTTARAQRFIDRFVKQRPDPDELTRLRELAVHMLEQNSDAERVQRNERSVLEYCIDIAAAAVQSYPYEIRGRVMQDEKELLVELMHSMHIDPDSDMSRAF